MKTIIAYIIIYASGFTEAGISESLSQRIMEKIKKGWQPYGSISCNRNSCYQPMVKYAESEEER